MGRGLHPPPLPISDVDPLLAPPLDFDEFPNPLFFPSGTDSWKLLKVNSTARTLDELLFLWRRKMKIFREARVGELPLNEWSSGYDISSPIEIRS
ncbi:unnamed protein product [Linum trigynum]|uniref:Uncharacterized protein n=1 Tax=Linum trigynum TaxID=586398 RepID=A0AAV2GRJ2_9ROSI